MPTCLVIDGITTITYSEGSCPPEERSRSTVLHEEIVRPVCERLGLTLLRAASLAEAGLPQDQMLGLLTEVDVVVADLDRSETELFFRLGMRHALGRSTVHVVRGADGLPGPGATPHLVFPSHSDETDTARRQLMSALTAEPARAGATAGAEPVVAPEAVAAAAAGTGPEDVGADAPGLFDLMVEAETQMEALTGDMADVEAALSDIDQMMTLLAEEMARVDHPGVPMNKKMVVLTRMARAIDGPATELEAAADRFALRMKASHDAFRVFLEWVAATPREGWPEDTEGTLEAIASTDWGAQVGAEPVQESMAVISMFGAASQQMRRPVGRIVRAFQKMIRSLSPLDELRDKARELRSS
ncbi:hypothetical protein [Streptomyces termitum]|uniref:hypothetical protein n=1 Tax=Streptomyces termitum TaxID=67368 RepID=UPI0037B75C83